MKKIILISFAAALVCANSFSQEKKAGPKTAEQRSDQMFAKLDNELSFNNDQKVKVKEVILKREQQRDELRKQFKNSHDEFKTANRKNMKESNDALKAMLTSDQKAKLKEYRKAARQERKNKMGNSSPAPNGQDAQPKTK